MDEEKTADQDAHRGAEAVGEVENGEGLAGFIWVAADDAAAHQGESGAQ